MSERVNQFEDLRIWQEARQLVVHLYGDFKDGPGVRDFGFKDQIQRAGISIMNNIAEGFERETDTDFAKFLDYAKGSCGEVRSMYYVAEDEDYMASTTANERRELTKKISRGIAALTKHLRQK